MTRKKQFMKELPATEQTPEYAKCPYCGDSVELSYRGLIPTFHIQSEECRRKARLREAGLKPKNSKQNSTQEYLSEKVNYGGELVSRGAMIADMQKRAKETYPDNKMAQIGLVNAGLSGHELMENLKAKESALHKEGFLSDRDLDFKVWVEQRDFRRARPESKWTDKDREFMKMTFDQYLASQIEVLDYIPKGYNAKRLVTKQDADIFKISEPELAKMLISEYEENDEAIESNNDYEIVKAGSSIFIYKKHLGDLQHAPKMVKETKEAYFYRFPSDRFYIVRKLSGDWVHYYPRVNGQLPEGYPSLKAAQKHVDEWERGQEIRIIRGAEASEFEVPKRW
jgi:hypothetical protein